MELQSQVLIEEKTNFMYTQQMTEELQHAFMHSWKYMNPNSYKIQKEGVTPFPIHTIGSSILYRHGRTYASERNYDAIRLESMGITTEKGKSQSDSIPHTNSHASRFLFLPSLQSSNRYHIKHREWGVSRIHCSQSLNPTTVWASLQRELRASQKVLPSQIRRSPDSCFSLHFSLLKDTILNKENEAFQASIVHNL